MSTLHIDGVAKRFGDTTALHALSLHVADGEFVTLLGPSGCGRTTLMRIIAGITPPDGGRVRVDGRDIHTLPPERRNIGLVFQSYALFPHMTVAANVGFGLRMRGVPRDETDARVQADRILVMKDGRIVEEGAPVDLYRRPRTRFAAEFLGQTNVLPLRLDGGRAVLPWEQAFGATSGHVSLRPEDIAMTADPAGVGEVRGVTFLGPCVECRVAVGAVDLRARDSGSAATIPAIGTRVALTARVTPHPLADEARPG